MKKFVYLLMVLLLCSTVQAYILISQEAIKKEISPFGTAEFKLNIKNTGFSKEVLKIISADVTWNVQTDPLTDYMNGIEIPGASSKETKLLLKPDRNIKEGTYFVQVDFIQENEKKLSEFFEIRVDSKIIDYPIFVSAEITEPAKIDPRKPASVSVRIRNDNPIYITGAKIQLSSKYINQEANVDIPANSEKIVQFSVSFTETIHQQKDTVKVIVSKENDTIAQTQKEIEISTYIKPYQTETKRVNEFLKIIDEVTFKNIEPVEKEQAAIFPVSDLSGIFTETKPKSKIIEMEGKKYFVWEDVSLKPNEAYTVKVITNYRIPALFALLFIVLIVLYYINRSPIVVRKHAEKVKIKEGGISELNVVINIKNRSNKTIKDVRVLDRLPKLSGISEEFGQGTPEPKIRKHHKEGFVLDWEGLLLEPGEERIFSYKIESKLPIVGNLELKPTLIQFGPKKRKVYSNVFNLFVE